MKVYCVIEVIPYEESTIEGIFSTEEKAQEYINSRHPLLVEFYVIEEWEVK